MRREIYCPVETPVSKSVIGGKFSPHIPVDSF